MNKLPLSPEDVTEFTCECAVDYEKQYQSYASRGITDAYCGKLRELAIAAEWAHGIAMVVADIDFETMSLADAGRLMGERRVLQSASSLKDWLDSLKGGQNG